MSNFHLLTFPSSGSSVATCVPFDQLFFVRIPEEGHTERLVFLFFQDQKQLYSPIPISYVMHNHCKNSNNTRKCVKESKDSPKPYPSEEAIMSLW